MQNTASFWPPRGGTAFRLLAGATLTVIDPEGTQVADLLAFNVVDIDEVVSSGRTLDHAESIRLTTGNTLFSNRSRKMLPIIEDTVEPPLSKGGDHISFRAEMDLVIGLAAWRPAPPTAAASAQSTIGSAEQPAAPRVKEKSQKY